MVDPDGTSGLVLLHRDGLPWRTGDESACGTSMGRRKYVLVSLLIFQILFLKYVMLDIYHVHVVDDIFVFVLQMWG